MLRWITQLAGAVVLATASAAPAQQGSEATEAPPLESLVLVLNIISTTHARPVTGVVLQAEDPAQAALVLVPAQFVSAGDEIIVLDGGTDILRNGRPSRTVARSVETGVAVLEVEGLQRAGVRLSADAWPPEARAEMAFAAWPAAGDLVEGASLVRRKVTVAPDSDSSPVLVVPALPDLSGPLFNSCGQLAAVHIAGDGVLAKASSIERLLDSAGLAVSQSSCSRPEEPDVPANTQQAEPAEELGLPGGTSETGAEPAEAANLREHDGVPPASSPTWLLVVLLLGLAGGVFYLRRRAAPVYDRILLEAVGDQGRSLTHELRLKPEGHRVRFEHDGLLLTFERSGGRVLVSDRSDDSERLKLVVAGTPCLPGEVMEVREGDEMWLGGQRFRLRLALEAAGREGTRDE